LVLSCLAPLFVLRDFEWNSLPISTIWNSWHHWDTGHYLIIATRGYDVYYRTAFFPLYPLLERAMMVFTFNNAFLAGLLISNIAGLVMLMALYRLVKQDFDQERALRTVLYLSVFPTAFFFAAAYNESLFLCLSLLSFYEMRHGRWWLAGLFGFLASLTRSVGLLLLLPFCYEYLRQRQFRLKAIRFDVVSGALIPAGIVVFAIYCYYRFNDALAFSHAQLYWNHRLQAPWYAAYISERVIRTHGGFLNFYVLRNLLDFLPDVLFLALIVGIFIGPWKFSRDLWAYGFYAVALYIFFQLFPVGGTGLFPLQSVSRYLLEVFPVFIVLAGVGIKSRTFNMSYVMVSGAILFFLLTQFLTGHWVL
ncbi:MAG TPA: mannosyltransferase family protein, partial [Ktedonobacteraceae bacterium]